LRANEQSIDVHAEVLARVGECKELEELRIVQEEESAEDEALLLQEFVHLALEHLEVHSHLLEDSDPLLDHEVVDGLGILVARPHDSLELQPGVDELLGGLPEDVREDSAVVDDVKVDPVSLGIDPDLQVLVHHLQLLDPSNDVLLDVRGKLAL